MSHIYHPDTHTHGLFPGCPECEAKAEYGHGLDQRNLHRILVAKEHHTDLDRKAFETLTGPKVPRLREALPMTRADRADAVQAVAGMFPDVRQVRWGTDEPVNPYMPEGDAAVLRSIRALIDRGDTCASKLGKIMDAWNLLAERWDTNHGVLTWEQMEDFSEVVGSVSRVSYEWQKSRERMAFVAEHRHAAAYEEAKR